MNATAHELIFSKRNSNCRNSISLHLYSIPIKWTKKTTHEMKNARSRRWQDSGRGHYNREDWGELHQLWTWLLPGVTFGVTWLIVFQHYIINFNCLSSLRLCIHLCRVWRCIQSLDKTKTKWVFKSSLVITDGRLLLLKSRVYFASHRLKRKKKKTTTEQNQTSLKSFSSFAIICSFLFSLASSSPVLNSMWWIFCL